MTVKRDVYTHRGNKCIQTRVYGDGCREVKVKDRRNGAITSHVKVRTPRHQNW